ncbi:MAG TPA: hypothetical protein PLR83_04830 [Pyrinomonadaceae bacterium]|nr:hypothetical protein [Pyrinomonadaceae bacterium]
MKRAILFFVILSAVGLYAGSTVYAKPGRCLLVIDGKKYISGKCDIDMYSDGTGSFQITELRKKGAYFAQVLVSPGTALGYWNGARDATHAHDPLGEMTRNGACWQNDRARICAWK